MLREHLDLLFSYSGASVIFQSAEIPKQCKNSGVCVCVCIESSQKVYEWPSWPTTEVGGRELDNLGHLDGHLSSQTQVVEEDFEICGNQNHLEFSFLCSKSVNKILQIIQMNATRLRGLFQCGRANTGW